jgi:hypothetical protein
MSESPGPLPTYLRILTNRHNGLSIVTCGTAEVTDTINRLRYNGGPKVHSVIGDCAHPLCEGTDFDCRLSRTLPGGTPAKEIQLAKNEVISSLGPRCLTEINRKLAAKDARENGEKRYTIFMVAAGDCPKRLFGIGADGQSRFMINLRARSKTPSAKTHDFAHGKELFCRELSTLDSEDEAKRALAQIQEAYERQNRLVGITRTATLRRPLVAGTAEYERFQGIMHKVRSAASEFDAEVRGGQSADDEAPGEAAGATPSGAPEGPSGGAAAMASRVTPSAAKGSAGEGAAATVASLPPMRSGREEVMEAALGRKRRHETATLPWYGIYLFEHAQEVMQYLAGTEDIDAYMRIVRDRMHTDCFAKNNLWAVMMSQPEDYFPRLLEEMTNVSKSRANVRLQYWRNELKKGPLAAPEESSPDRARGPKLLLLSAPDQRMATVVFTNESLHEFKQRMLHRQRTATSGRDKDVRILRVLQEPDHRIEILEVLRPEDSRAHYMGALRAQTDRLRSKQWNTLTDGKVQHFYRILRTDPNDPRCYVGRTTQEVAVRIASHHEKLNSQEYVSHEIMADGQCTYETLGSFRLPSTLEANKIEARLIARYPHVVNRDYALQRTHVIGTHRDPFYGMDINDIAVALGGIVVKPVEPLAGAAASPTAPVAES